MRRIIQLGLSVLLLNMLLVGCGPTQTTPQPGANQTPASSAGEPSTASAPDPGQAPAPVSASTLKGYRQTVMFTEEVEGAQPTRWTMNVEHDGATRASRSIMSGTDGDGNDLSWESVRIGDATYMRSGDEWITIESSQADQPSDVLGLEQPESLMQGGGCQRQGTDSINGLPATHYRCDQSRFMEQMALAGAEGTITSAEVELWVADQFNIIVRSVMAWEGATPDGRKLKSNYESVLSDVDKPIQIAKPEGAPEAGVSADIPIPPDIADRMAMPDMVSFRVGQGAQQVADFYQREMTQKGWTLQAEGTLVPSLLVYTQGDRTATITLSEEGSRTTVMITVQEQ